MQKSKIMYYVKIVGVLTLIASLVAMMLGFVNELTADRIAANEEAKLNDALKSIFGDYTSADILEGVYDEPVCAVYRIKQGSDISGYGVTVTTNGYGGEIDMLVGVSKEGRVIGVQIISMSETPGLGSKVDDPDYLAGYIGLDCTARLGEDIDALSGATRTSKAVYSGVNAALSLDIYENSDHAVEVTQPIESDLPDADLNKPEKETVSDEAETPPPQTPNTDIGGGL